MPLKSGTIPVSPQKENEVDPDELAKAERTLALHSRIGNGPSLSARPFRDSLVTLITIATAMGSKRIGVSACQR